jgi:hypothetical protein
MVGVGAENLYADRMFVRFKMEKAFGIFRMMKQPFGAHHLRHQYVRPVSPANPAKNGFGDAGHWGQEKFFILEIHRPALEKVVLAKKPFKLYNLLACPKMYTLLK